MDKVKLLEGLKKIKEAFISVQKFVDAKLNDGTTIIRYDGDALIVGTPVLVVTDQGAIAIPDGDYELEDTTKFTITGGVVSAVTPAEAPAKEGAPAPTAQAAAPAKPAAMTEANANAKAIVESIIKETRFAEEIAELKTQIAEFKAVKENFATQKESSEKEIATLKETVTGIFKIVEQIAAEPSAKPAEKKKETFSISDWKKDYKADLERLHELQSK